MVDLSDTDIEQGEESLAERLAANEPVFRPTTLERLAEADLPLRGPLRQRIVENARDRALERRTIEGISRRVATNISAPITEIVQQSIEGRVQERVRESVTRIAANRSENK